MITWHTMILLLLYMQLLRGNGTNDRSMYIHIRGIVRPLEQEDDNLYSYKGCTIAYNDEGAFGVETMCNTHEPKLVSIPIVVERSVSHPTARRC